MRVRIKRLTKMPKITANNIDITYESFGKESDPTVLMIMGLGG